MVKRRAGRAASAGLASLLALVAACTPPVDPGYRELLGGGETGVLQPQATTLGPGDRLAIRVYQDEKLGGEFAVASDGTISFPLVGKVEVQGLTCSHVEDDLVERLAAGYIRTPSVTCSVVAFNSKKIFVFGEVKEPGAFVFEDSMSVVQAVTLAGGFSDRAAPNETALVRTVAGEKRRVRIPMEQILRGEVENLLLLPGDILFVPTSIY